MTTSSGEKQKTQLLSVIYNIHRSTQSNTTFLKNDTGFMFLTEDCCCWLSSEWLVCLMSGCKTDFLQHKYTPEGEFKLKLTVNVTWLLKEIVIWWKKIRLIKKLINYFVDVVPHHLHWKNIRKISFNGQVRKNCSSVHLGIWLLF